MFGRMISFREVKFWIVVFFLFLLEFLGFCFLFYLDLIEKKIYRLIDDIKYKV